MKTVKNPKLYEPSQRITRERTHEVSHENKTMYEFIGEFFGFKFSVMNLGLGVTALIFFVSFFVSRQKMKSQGGLSRIKSEM